MEKEFIPYEQALALKELGFNEPCLAQYKKYEVGEAKLDIGFSKNELIMQFHKLSKFCTAPLYQQAFRWLLVLVNKDELFSNKWSISYNEDYYSLFLGGCNMGVFEEELACLKKLIEIVKENVDKQR
jgi:hypothetical protein